MRPVQKWSSVGDIFQLQILLRQAGIFLWISTILQAESYHLGNHKEIFAGVQVSAWYTRFSEQTSKSRHTGIPYFVWLELSKNPKTPAIHAKPDRGLIK